MERFPRNGFASRALAPFIILSPPMSSTRNTTRASGPSAETAFTAVVDLITEEIVEKEEAAVSGLGTFMIRSRSSRKGRNFQTGTSVQIPSSKSVGFRAGKNLKEAVNK